MPSRRHESDPATFEGVAAVLKPFSQGETLMPTGWYIGPPGYALPFMEGGYFRTTRRLHGEQRSLRRGNVHCMSGVSFNAEGEPGSILVARLFIQRAGISLDFVPVSQQLPDIAAEGIQGYLNGYPSEQSQAVRTMIEANERALSTNLS